MNGIKIDIRLEDNRQATAHASTVGRLSKQDEIDVLHGLVNSLPDSYLRDMLRHIEIQFENDTRSDYPCIPNLRAIEMDIEEKEEERRTLRVTINQMQEDQQNLRTELRKLRHIASETSKHVGDQAQTLQNWARSLNRVISELGQKGS